MALQSSSYFRTPFIKPFAWNIKLVAHSGLISDKKMQFIEVSKAKINNFEKKISNMEAPKEAKE